MGLFNKLNIVTNNKEKLEANAVKVTFFSKTINHIGQSVKDGKISNKTAGIIAVVSIIGYLVASKFPESQISKLLIENAESIGIALVSIVPLLIGFVKK